MVNLPRCSVCGAHAIGLGKVDRQGYCVEHALGIILVALNADNRTGTEEANKKLG